MPGSGTSHKCFTHTAVSSSAPSPRGHSHTGSAFSKSRQELRAAERGSAATNCSKIFKSPVSTRWLLPQGTHGTLCACDMPRGNSKSKASKRKTSRYRKWWVSHADAGSEGKEAAFPEAAARGNSAIDQVLDGGLGLAPPATSACRHLGNARGTQIFLTSTIMTMELCLKEGLGFRKCTQVSLEWPTSPVDLPYEPSL